MPTLSAVARRAMPAGQFAGPGRSFPIPDTNHARLALAMAMRSMHAGNLSAAQAAAIRAKVKARYPGIG